MTTKSETVLQALFAILDTNKPAGSKLLRNATLPERIPSGGIAILRDGDPGRPEVLLSPATYIYEHRAEIDVVIEAAAPTTRDAAFDLWKSAIGTALATDRTLGGLCDYVLGDAPAPLDLMLEGADGMKAATVGIVLTYSSPDPLS